MFADFRGISRLRDEHYEAFVGGVLGPLGRITEQMGSQILYRNSWGDADQLVARTVSSAATWALDVQRTISNIDMGALGLPDDLQLRIAVHAGRLIPREDPIRGVLGFWGRE